MDLLTSHRESGEAAADLSRLPVVLKVKGVRPEPGMTWSRYRERVQEHLSPMQHEIEVAMGIKAAPILAANAFQLVASPAQIRKLAEEEGVEFVELDPLLQVVSMDDAAVDVGLPELRMAHPNLNGTGVRVAVLDSGVDDRHPFLDVAASVGTSGEHVDIPGSHGTHCAGSIASQDDIFPGIAPNVTLYNVKVLRADGRGTHTNIALGVDAALDLGAQVLSMSLGFNHLPPWTAGGHGWACTDGRCALCTAVDNAVLLDDVVVVVAAANERARAEALRAVGHGQKFDTELGCPGQAREAITVGAVTKRMFLPAAFSSRGPTSYGDPKPDLAAPGVNLTSTVPVPRRLDGTPEPNSPRSYLFDRKSGTSMATPIVAGAVALLIQKKQDSGHSWTPREIRQELISACSLPSGGTVAEVGAGVLDLSKL